ncbi:MAG: D-glycerate dehydrogenase [Anaerolineales bacterium]|nr:D-glycerate dehydrogenase [Anaerolineales bacterium]
MKDNKPLILMTNELPEDWVGNLFNEYHVIVGRPDQRGLGSKLIIHLDQAEGILCLLDDPIPGDLLEQASNLKVVSAMAVGVDNIDVSTCTRLGIPVGHTPGVLTEGTADLTVALLLAVCRKLAEASDDARQGRWNNWDPTGWLGMDLKNSTVGIVGLGKIGTAVGERLTGFGTKIIFTNRSPQPEKAADLNAIQVNLDELIRTSDFICLHVPLTDETINLIDENEFQNMKSTAILINAARGSVVNTPALVRALKNGQIRAAGLDVTNPEPLPPDHPLFELDNCLITPHIGSATIQTRKTMARIAIENLSAGITGSRLPHCVNPEIYK